MASNTPSPDDPRPDDRNPPRPERQLDWLGAEEVGPAPGAGSHDPDPITEQVLFDDLLPLTNPPASGGPIPTAEPVTQAPLEDPEDAMADLPPAGPQSGWVDAPAGTVPAPGSSVFDLGQVPGGSDVFAAPPSGKTPTGPFRMPGSSIFELTPPPVGKTASDSDVLSDALEEGSDVLGKVARPGPGASSIFEARPEGSGRFEGPADAAGPVSDVRVPDPSGEWAAADPLRPGSEIFEDPDAAGPRPGSGVFEARPGSGTFEARPGSGVFDAGRPGSGVFDDQATDYDAGRPGSEIFDEQATDADAVRPGSEVFDDQATDFDAGRPGSEVFEDQPTDAAEWPGSEIFDDQATDAGVFKPDEPGERAAGVPFPDSGVDLLHPAADLPADEVSGGGSIFDMEKPGPGASDLLEADALQLPDDSEASSILPTGETGPRSDLFRGPDSGTGDHERVSFELPDHPPGAGDPSQQVSGLIDWTAPVEGVELSASAGLTDSEAAQAGVPNLRELTAETQVPVTTPGPRRPSTIPDMRMTERQRPDSRPGSQWMFYEEPRAKTGGRTGWLVGSALGLLLGAGAVTGAYFAGLLPSRTSEPARVAGTAGGTQKTEPKAVPTPTPGNPAALLAAGDPAAALKAYEAAGEVTAPEDRAGRGQARFLARVRELADQGAAPRADDPQLKQAQADLEAVVQAAGTLETDEQKRAGALAALHLGLIKELTGDTKGAQDQYRGALTAFPAYKRMFESALKRERLAPKTAPAKTARLTPREAEELAQLALIATVLLQAPEGDAAGDDEPGFLFWEACELNAGQKYKEAADLILQVRAAHEKRRMKLAGRGLNPLSDPLEQMFTVACNQIREYWVLKQHFYGHEQLGNEMRTHAQKGTFPKFLSEVVALREEVKTGGGEKLAKVQAALTKAGEELKAAAAAAMKASAEKDVLAKEKDAVAKDLTAAKQSLDEHTKQLAAAKQSLDEQSKQLTDARKGLDDARAKQKAADGVLAAVVKELKANKLIAETDDAAAAAAKLPEVVRKAAAAATSTDAQKAAEALVKAQKDLEAARAETDKAEATAKKAADEAKTLRDRLDAEVRKAAEAAKTLQAQMGAEVKKATDAAAADARKRLDDLTAQLTAARDELARHEKERADALRKAEAEFAAKLAAKEEEHRRQLADVRTGVATPLTTAEVAARDRASQEYDAGVRLFFASRYAEAEAMLDRATRNDATDARYWYYLGLAQALQRKPAEEALKKGAELEARNQPGRRALNDALEPLPGTYRQWLSRFRP